MIDVLVVGAGPTGLMMAAELARYGFRCRLIDKEHVTRDETRAAALQPRTLEIFAHLDIVHPFLAQGLKVKGMNPMSEGKRLAHLSFGSIDSLYPFILSLQQEKTEAILREYALKFGVHVERGVELLSFQEHADWVTVQLNGETIDARWVVGCDGAHSIVRKGLNLPFPGTPFPEVFSLADLHIDWELPHDEAYAFLHARGALAAIPLPEPNRYRLIYSQGKETVEEPTLSEIEKRLKAYSHLKLRLYDPIWMSNFHIHTRIAPTFQKGRVFLAGDAAHIHSPIGGQGMNTGIQDAFNLAWKLKYGGALLNTYSLERHKVGKGLLFVTEKASYMVTLHNRFLIWCRNHILSVLSEKKWFQEFLPRLISQIAIRYPKSCLTQDDSPSHPGPKVGTRAPLFPLTLSYMWKESKKFYVLLFAGPQGEDLSQIASQIRSEHVEPILIPDSEGDAHRIYKVSAPAVFIIRPDTYIGYRSERIDVDSIKKYFLFE